MGRISFLNPTKAIIGSLVKKDCAECGSYWTHPKNPLAIKLKDEVALVNIWDIYYSEIREVLMNLVWCEKSLWRRILSMLSSCNLFRGRSIESEFWEGLMSVFDGWCGFCAHESIWERKGCNERRTYFCIQAIIDRTHSFRHIRLRIKYMIHNLIPCQPHFSGDKD